MPQVTIAAAGCLPYEECTDFVYKQQRLVIVHHQIDSVDVSVSLWERGETETLKSRLPPPAGLAAASYSYKQKQRRYCNSILGYIYILYFELRPYRRLLVVERGSSDDIGSIQYNTNNAQSYFCTIDAAISTPARSFIATV